ncbi:MAG TPA: methyltransferase domain-containing protein [Dokdonella sp.]|uniref:class I SAM-dependent methyltransferase n=1 Tax=Dokdonella sp. TaxID=2291710 RepID=UPI002CE1707D|nr:methyltransferase domain-containing protein [Xanthomonadales bacterium]HQV73081.1 methyltransferase domain-containing protein [Dokdonella sp.]MBL0223351.1 methyltransferase domain-containing protein [Xanthomonadales bacterium]HQW75430.1 methyltransferase domain-containing protein [Dokdonella sp.]HQX65331.1 methyltransferase domain-containing protein [Dokdonella sp.]
MQISIPDASVFARQFEPHGSTDRAYLAHHFGRFASTLVEFCTSWDLQRGNRVLDIGAHWLHQSILWKQAGFDITAVDLPITFEMANVQSIARAMDIKLIPCANLEAADAFDAIADSSADVILFTEIIEHLTFNPIRFWKQVHRILAPNGRLVVTTPNYYAWNGRAWDFGRFLRGFGGGISVDAILGTHTYGHHWREFSKHEVIRYFCLLSPDFNTVKAKTVRNYYPEPNDARKKLASGIYERFPGLRPNLHLEIELSSKDHGIVMQPSW